MTESFGRDIFESEIAEVESSLLAATTDLTNPLGDLVRAQIKRSQPPIYGALVLAVSKPQAPGQESNSLHRKRILLAAALEMLHVALNVHRILVNAAVQKQPINGDNSLDRSFIGSTILAGDYCFSRAAQMAAQTDHPRVVATFSLALQIVSEGLLREQFNAGNSTEVYDETSQLLASGTQAAAFLIDLPEKQQQQAVTFSQEVALQWGVQQANHHDGNHQGTFPSAPSIPITSFTPYWQTLFEWLKNQARNGTLPPFSQHHFG